MGKSILYNYTKEEMQKIVDESSSIKEAKTKLGLYSEGGNRSTLWRVFKEYEIDLSKLEQKRKLFLKEQRSRMHFEQTTADGLVFCENSKINRAAVKSRIIKNHLMEYKCRDCGNIGWWNNKPLTLQLEHINGIPNDNRLENLCFLCPSCHSQTDTYSGKKLKKEKHFVPKEKRWRNSSISQRKLSEENVLYILQHKDEISMLQMSKMFGVSDKTIAKIIKNNGYII